MKLGQLTDTLRRHRDLVFLCLSITATMLGQGAISPVLPLFADQEFHVNRTQVGLAVGLFGVGRMVTSLPAGYLAQRYGRRMVLIIGTAGNLIGTAGVAVSFSFGWLVGWRIVSGLGSSMFTTGVSVYLRDVSTPENRGRFLSLQELSILAGVTIGPVLGGYMGNQLGLRTPLVFDTVLMLCALGLVVGFVPESRPAAAPAPSAGHSSSRVHSPERPAPGAYRSLLLNPGFLFVGLFSLMIVANRQGARFSIMPLYGSAKGFGADQLGLFLSLTHLPQFFAVLAAGFLADRFGRKSTIIPAAILISLGLLWFIQSDNLAGLMGSGVLLGVGEGLAGPPLVAFFADIAPPGLEGVTMGFFRTFGGVGSLVGAVVLGTIADLSSFAWSLRTDAALLSAAALGMVFIVRETAARPGRGAQTPS